MKQVSVSISTYTADVSGVCSALYELGGMVVIHDPSGCNSTYNTHDEPRWYEQDSLVFISGLSEIDAIMGNDEKFIADIVRAARELSPKFIALVRSPVPMMIGTDFAAIRMILEEETGLPVFYFPTSGMQSYITGAGMALTQVARSMTKKIMAGETAVAQGEKTAGTSVNLLGVTPLDFSVNTTLSSLRTFWEKQGYTVRSVFAMGSSPEEIAGAGEAGINLVVSSVGLPAARVLKEKFGTPYVVGLPVGVFGKEMVRAVKESLHDGRCRTAYAEEPWKQTEEKRKLYLIGEAVITQSLAAAIRRQYGWETKVLCPLETEEEVLEKNSRRVMRCDSEEALQQELKAAAGIIADPLYQPICPEQTPFFPLPHEAFSGRIYRRRIPDLLDVRFLDEWIREAMGRPE